MRLLPGTCIKTSGNMYYYVKSGKDGLTLHHMTQRVFESWNFPNVFKLPDDGLLNGCVTGVALGFRDGTVIGNIMNGKKYIISDRKRMEIDDIKSLPFRTKIIWASQNEVNLHKDGGKY